MRDGPRSLGTDGSPRVPGLREQLPHSFDALLARHGRPTPIQEQAVPVIREGHSALLMAPTASGKTEAALAPLLERWWEPLRGADQPVVLIVSPTRALANDLFRRLEARLSTMELRIGRWTGDAHDGGSLQPLTVVTPEGFDGRFSRVPEKFLRVAAVWLEELQVVDGTARGDQLRLLLMRLQSRLLHAGLPAPQRVATSATVADPEGLARRFLGEGARIVRGDAPADGLPARTEGARRALGRRMRVLTGDAMGLVSIEPLRQTLHKLVSESGFRKVLLFADSRARTEEVAAGLIGQPPFGDAVLVHHGSLERQTRQVAERRFLDAKVAACCATSTLEVGIDIGDVDLVVLLSCPPSVSALLQRAGRAGRRSGVAQVLTWVAEPASALRLQVLLEAIKSGVWLEEPHVFHDGVLVQQVFSVLGEREAERRFGVTSAALVRRFPGVWDEARLSGLLEGLKARGWLGGGPARYTWGDHAEGPWRRGELHANMAERRDEGVELVDAVTGRTLGRVREDAATSDRVNFGGRKREILGTSEGRLLTRADRSAVDAVSAFTRAEGPPLPRAQARAILAAVELSPGLWVSLEDGTLALVHGLGTGGGLLLKAIYGRYRGVKVKRAGPFAVVLESSRGPLWPTWPHGDFLAGDEPGIAQRMGASPWHRLLPDGERLAATLRLAGADALKELLAAGPGPVIGPFNREESQDDWRLTLMYWE